MDYRLLREGETIQEGDEVFNGLNLWSSCEYTRGLPVDKLRRPIRRRITETPPLPQDLQHTSAAPETPSPQASSPVKEQAPHDPFDQWLTSNRKHEVNTDNIYVASEAFEAGMKYERSVIKGVESKAE